MPGVFFYSSVKWLKAGKVFSRAFMVVEYDNTVRLIRERRQHVVLVAEVNEDHVFTRDIRRLLAVNAGHKLDVSAERFPDNPSSTEAIGAVSVIDAHRFALNLRHRNTSPAAHRQVCRGME
ncbi:hypothetical protein H096_24003 [Pseudomonas sp. FH1]|nr:hypothetical protein H096_24003 [Pseudomonas sp. FH1]